MNVSLPARCVLATVALAACMPEIVRTRTVLQPSAPGDRAELCLAADTEVDPQVGITSDLAKGSCWRLVGTVEQGDVYRRVGGVFMLNSANAHEAYLVVKDDAVVGFYLPGESAYAPAREKAVLTLDRKGE